MNTKRIAALVLLLCASAAMGMKRKAAESALPKRAGKRSKPILAPLTLVNASLHKTTWAADLPRIKALVDEDNADVNSINPSIGTTPLMIAACNPTSTTIIKFFLDKGANPNVKDFCGYTAFAKAAGSYDGLANVKLLLNHGIENIGVPTQEEINELRKMKNTYFSLFSPDLVTWFGQRYGEHYTMPNAMRTEDVLAELNAVENKKKIISEWKGLAITYELAKRRDYESKKTSEFLSTLPQSIRCSEAVAVLKK